MGKCTVPVHLLWMRWALNEMLALFKSFTQTAEARGVSTNQGSNQELERKTLLITALFCGVINARKTGFHSVITHSPFISMVRFEPCPV